jgi:ADP-heptose:LPS heptosyltransferase
MNPAAAMVAPRRIAVFRALQLGDTLVAIPALRALRKLYPSARLTLVSLPWAQELARRFAWVDDFLPFPGHPQLPERSCEPSLLEAFFTQARRRRLDLALQLHGSGLRTNAIVAQLGAHAVGGFYPGGTPCPDPQRFVPWPEHGSEAERLARLPVHLGAPPPALDLELPLTAGDRLELAALWRKLGGHPQRYVCIHPGARWASRRWPAARFAAIAARLAQRGYTPVLTGGAGDADALHAFRAAGGEGLDASGRTSLGSLAALIAGARLLVCNDTGVSHVAAATRTPSVVISSGADVARWRPSDVSRHRVLHHQVACRPCAHERCPTGHECALGVSAERVLDECLRLLATELPRAA